LVVLKNLFVF